MDYANYWASAVATADLGDTIDQSLRFRRTQFLKSAAITTSTFTVSVWVKIGRLRNPTISGGVTSIVIGTAGTAGHGIGFSNNKLYSSHTGVESSEEFRDPSAWYHLVANSTGSIYINNTEILSGGGLRDPSGQEIIIGHIFPNTTQQSTYAFDGLLADYHFIDGSELTPSSFARTNDDGVWVPDTFTGSYGTNGAHLVFDNSLGIGNDSSGQNNDYTASGFDTADVALYSKDLFTESGTASPDFDSTDKTFASGGEAVNAFDGNTSNEAGTLYSPNTGTWVIWRPTTAIVAQTSVKVRTRFCEAIYVNETDTGLDAPAAVNLPGTLVDLSSALSFPITITNIAVRGNSSGGNASEGRITDIEIDGTILVDNTDNDVDFFDTPTSNYPTANPLNSNASSISNANLKYVGDTAANSNLGVIGSQSVSSGKFYWETVIDDVGNATFGSFIGVTPSSTPGVTATDLPNKTGTYTYRPDGNKQEGTGSGNTQSSYGNTYTTGDIISVALDMDNGAVYFAKNGVYQNSGDPTSGATKTGAAFTSFVGSYTSVNGGLSGATGSLNFGQMQTIYSVPTGYKALQTNNLPEPTIKNGKEHFAIDAYATGNPGGYTSTELEFQPDLVWIKRRNGGTDGALFDSVRGVHKGLIICGSSSTGDDAEFDESDTLTAFNSDGFTVSTDDRVGSNNNTYIAWCWKAGGTAVSNTNGTITSSVSANTDAGFSIVSYTGTSTDDQTIGHGLDSTPEFVIYKNRDQSVDWYVYHKDLAQSGSFLQFVKLNSSAAQTTAGGGIDEHPDANVLKVNNNSMINGTGNDMIAYCWHSVEGFSKISTWTGNGSSTDNAFVYTGFSVAWLLLKRLNGGTDWLIFDSTRDTTNPNESWFKTNKNDSESVGSDASNGSIDIDFLSNGFKIRSNSGTVGASGGTYAFMAFASSPFGGENAPPATAR